MTTWNVELLKSSEDKYTLFFLSYEGSLQKIINSKNELFNICKNLHEKDYTFWTVESIEKRKPKEFESENELRTMLEKINNKI